MRTASEPLAAQHTDILEHALLHARVPRVVLWPSHHSGEREKVSFKNKRYLLLNINKRIAQ